MIILDLLFLSWVFWPLMAFLVCLAYARVALSRKVDRGDYPAGPELLLAAVTFGFLWHYPAAWAWMKDWHHVLLAWACYVAAGFASRPRRR